MSKRDDIAAVTISLFREGTTLYAEAEASIDMPFDGSDELVVIPVKVGPIPVADPAMLAPAFSAVAGAAAGALKFLPKL